MAGRLWVRLVSPVRVLGVKVKVRKGVFFVWGDCVRGVAGGREGKGPRDVRGGGRDRWVA